MFRFSNSSAVIALLLGRHFASNSLASSVARLAETMPDRRDPDHIQHQMVEMVTARVTAIACGHEDAIDHNDLRHDPLMKVAVGRCPESGAPLGSQSTISRLENAPSKTDAARLTVALIDQFGTTVTPGRMEMFDIDDTFCVAHGGQQLALGGQVADVLFKRNAITIFEV